MSTFIRGSNPIWYMVDLVGAALDDTYFLFVLQNDLPYLPETVWHDPNGNVPWTDPIQFLPNGTLPVDIYYDEDVVYRLEIRHGNTQADALIYPIENYSPGSGGAAPQSSSITTDNQITNAQFSLINFTSPYALTNISSPDPIEVAPGWTLHLTGNGNVTLERVDLTDSTSTQNPTNASYALRITLTGSWSVAYLAQRFNRNGNLWSSVDTDRYVSTSITARLQGGAQSISAILINSDNDILSTILSPVILTEEWNQYQDYGLMPTPEDSNAPADSYIEYRLELPTTVDIYVTSFQLISQDSASNLPYNQDSIQRQIDHTFHYYKDPLMYKPIPSYTIGWDFKFNPFQELGPTPGTIANGPSSYIADQTILFQSTNNRVSVNLVNECLELGIVSSPVSCAIVQYLDAASAYELLNNIASVQLRAKVSNSTLNGTISLWWTADVSLPDITDPTFQSLVSSIGSGGVPTCNHGTWNQVPRPSIGNGFSRFSLTTDFDSYNAIGFDASNVDTSTATYFAIVVCFDTYAEDNSIAIEYCSLMNGIIPTRPAPLSFPQTLSALQYCYETSYPYGSPVGSATDVNALRAYMQQASSGISGVFPRSFSIIYKEEKRAITDPVIYAPDGTLDEVLAVDYNINTTAVEENVSFSDTWQFVNQGTFSTNTEVIIDRNTRIASNAGFTSDLERDEALIFYHFVNDSRFGVI